MPAAIPSTFTPTAKSGTPHQTIDNHYLRSLRLAVALCSTTTPGYGSSYALSLHVEKYPTQPGVAVPHGDRPQIKRGPANGTPMLYPPVSDSGAAESAHPGKKRQPTVILHAPCQSNEGTLSPARPMNPIGLRPLSKGLTS